MIHLKKVWSYDVDNFKNRYLNQLLLEYDINAITHNLDEYLTKSLDLLYSKKDVLNDNFVANPYLKIKSFEYTEIEENIHFAFVPMLNTYNELTVIDSQLSEKDNLIFSIIDYGEMINGYTIIQTLNEAEIELNGELINRNMNYLLRSFLGYQYIILEK